MKKLEMTFLEAFLLMIFSASLALAVASRVNEWEDERTWWILTVISALLLVNKVRVVKKAKPTKPIGNLFVFNGETDDRVAIGLEITEDLQNVIEAGEGVLRVVDQRDISPHHTS